MKKIGLALLALACTPSAFAFDFSSINTWYGTGSNQAALVLDFKTGGPAYAIGWRFNGTATGQQMITAVAAADPTLDIEITSYSFGDAITGIRYLGNNAAGFGTGTSGYWGYWLGDNTFTSPSTWTSSPVGMSDRTLGNNSWDGWSWAPNFDDTAPTNNITSVPEPMSAVALVGGLAALARRRRKAQAA